MSNRTMVVLVYLLAAILALFPLRAAAFDYDVNWTSTNSKESVLIITIDKCDTKFKVKNEDLEAFQKNSKALTDAVKKAIERANEGCTKD